MAEPEGGGGRRNDGVIHSWIVFILIYVIPCVLICVISSWLFTRAYTNIKVSYNWANSERGARIVATPETEVCPNTCFWNFNKCERFKPDYLIDNTERYFCFRGYNATVVMRLGMHIVIKSIRIIYFHKHLDPHPERMPKDIYIKGYSTENSVEVRVKRGFRFFRKPTEELEDQVLDQDFKIDGRQDKPINELKFKFFGNYGGNETRISGIMVWGYKMNVSP